MNTISSLKSVADIMDPSDIKIIWQHLGKTFSLDIVNYQASFEKFLSMQPAEKTIAESFIEFGSTSIQPILNEILRRDLSYPTWNNLLRFILKDKLAESSEQLHYYRSGAWKSMTMMNREVNDFTATQSFMLM